MKAKKSINITAAIFMGLILGIVFGLFMPGRYEFPFPAVELVSSLYMNALRMMIYPLVFCSLIVGIQGIGSVDATGKIGGQSVLYFAVTTLFASTPVGVFCSISAVMYANGIETMTALGQVLVALYVTMFLYIQLVYGGIVKLIGKYPVGQFFRKIMPVALNAFGTCSGSATLPISKRCADDLGIPNEISSLALPLGATINMDAVSIVMSFMVVFFANVCGVELDFGLMVVVMLSNTLLSIHTNYADSLYYSQREDALLFATTPLDRGSWNSHPFTTLCACQAGRRLFQRTNHGKEYHDNAEDIHMIFADYAGL